MGAVGSFPSMRELNRRTVKGPVNPLDKSTIVSIYPKPISFKNPTLQPGRWELSAGSMEHPTMLVVGPSSWWKDTGIDEPLIEIVHGSVVIAESLIKDYMSGMFAVNMTDAMIGLFFIPGAVERKQLHTEYQSLLEQAKRYQENYYRTLIKYADALWARSNGNPLALNDEMRMAAKSLGVQDREWMKEHVNVGMVPCFACGAFKSPEYPICQACHTVDPKHPKAKLIQKFDPFHGMTEIEPPKVT